MAALLRALPLPGLARRRLLDAERRFFDAYGRGGDRHGDLLVIPADWFTRPAVEEALLAWARGGPLDEEALEAAWRDAGSPGSRSALWRNVAHYLSLV